MIHEITCRYGKTYELEIRGSRGAQRRLKDQLEKCCCWMCRNHDCDTPVNERVGGCGDECLNYAKARYCDGDLNRPE